MDGAIDSYYGLAKRLILFTSIFWVLEYIVEILALI